MSSENLLLHMPKTNAKISCVVVQADQCFCFCGLKDSIISIKITRVLPSFVAAEAGMNQT